MKRAWRSVGLSGGSVLHHFQVLVDDGQTLELVYDESADAWQVKATAAGPE